MRTTRHSTLPIVLRSTAASSTPPTPRPTTPSLDSRPCSLPSTSSTPIPRHLGTHAMLRTETRQPACWLPCPVTRTSSCLYNYSPTSPSTATSAPTSKSHILYPSSRLVPTYSSSMERHKAPKLKRSTKRSWKSTSSQTTSTSSLWSSSSPSDTTPRTCSTGQASSCATSAEKTTLEEGSGSVPTTSVAAGRSTRASLPSAADVDGQSTAAKNAKRAPGCSIATGAWPPASLRHMLQYCFSFSLLPSGFFHHHAYLDLISGSILHGAGLFFHLLPKCKDLMSDTTTDTTRLPFYSSFQPRTHLCEHTAKTRLMARLSTRRACPVLEAYILLLSTSISSCKRRWTAFWLGSSAQAVCSMQIMASGCRLGCVLGLFFPLSFTFHVIFSMSSVYSFYGAQEQGLHACSIFEPAFA